MDGYAVAAAMTHSATETRPLTLRLPEEAQPVNTGDALPPGADSVIMIEHTQELDGERIAIRSAVAPWQHVRPQGEDMVASELVLPPNHVLRPVDLGALAGCGHDSVLLRRRPRVHILPTGSELVAPGVAPASRPDYQNPTVWCWRPRCARRAARRRAGQRGRRAWGYS